MWIALLELAAVLATAWLLAWAVDRCYRAGLDDEVASRPADSALPGPDETLMHEEPHPAAVGSIMGA